MLGVFKAGLVAIIAIQFHASSVTHFDTRPLIDPLIGLATFPFPSLVSHFFKLSDFAFFAGIYLEAEIDVAKLR